MHFRGLEVPTLGSPRDKIFRDYLAWEARVEAKKHEMLMYLVIGSSRVPAEKEREWGVAIKKSFESYASLLWGMEPKEVTEEEQEMLEYYEEVLKKSKVHIKLGHDGKLVATGVPGTKSEGKPEPILPKSMERVKPVPAPEKALAARRKSKL